MESNNILIENYTPQELKNIAGDTQNIISSINEAINWVDTSLHLVEKTADDDKKYRTTYNLKSNRRKLKKVQKAITQKPTVAFFGESQVGKSYLVKNFFTDGSNNFFLYDNKNNKYDFITQMNPYGSNQESTSVVTRFTYNTQAAENLPPVSIKILSVKDLISIIADGYLADIKYKDLAFTEKIVKEHEQEVKKQISHQKQSIVCEDDIYDIKEYLSEFYEATNVHIFSAFEGSESGSDFWRFLGTNIENIPIDSFPEVFSILWGKNETLTKLFADLLNELKQLKFNDLIYTDFEAVLNGKGEILNVDTLNKYHDEKASIDLEITSQSGHTYHIKNSKLCALAKEVVFNIKNTSTKEKSKQLVENVDILDFPGARARKVFSEVDIIPEKGKLEVLLRGKVAYLFNSYSRNYEINSLVAANSSKQPEVLTIPEMINNWIKFNIGEDANEREKSLRNLNVPPLFVIFTWWNTQLHYEGQKDKIREDFSEKWEGRFIKTVKGAIFGTYNWHEKWTENSKFKNYYLIRDFQYSRDTFDGVNDEGIGVESKVKETRIEHYAKLKKSFTNSSLVKTFFDSPETTWNDTSIVGKDGTDFLIKNLLQIATNKVKTKRYLSIVEGAIKETKNTLKRIYRDESLGQSAENAKEIAGDIRGNMLMIFKENYLFGKFIEALQLTPDEISHIYYTELKNHDLVKNQELGNKQEKGKNYGLLRSSCKGIDASKSYAENLEALRDCHDHSSVEKTTIYFKDELKLDLNLLFYGSKKKIKKYSESLADKVTSYWINEKLDIKNFSFFIEKDILKKNILNLLNNLKNNFDKKLFITNKIAKTIGSWVDGIQGPIDDAEDMMAAVTAEIINNYINFYGWTDYSEEDKNRLKENNRKQKLGLVFPIEEEEFEKEEDEDLTEVFDFINNYEDKMNSVKDQKKPLKLYGGKIDSDEQTTIINNTPFLRNLYLWFELMKIGFVATCDIPDYDPKANEDLGTIIQNMEEATSSIESN